MSDYASVARAALGTAPTGTLNNDSLTIAFMEFLMDGDSNMMKSWWLKQGWQDISPLWGDKATVPTFKDKKAVIERWPEFQEEMLSVMADWYYVSGHHGCRFANDVGESDFFEFTQSYEHAGFFNEPYHVGPWEHADSSNPDAGRSSLDVYMATSLTEWENPYSAGPEDNPLHYNSQENCKGILLVGCRALGYLCSRQGWGAYFPNAVIIGPVTRESNSIAKLMKIPQKFGRGFYLDPKSVDPIDLCKMLNPVLGVFDRLAVMSDNTLYVPVSGGKVLELPADEPVERSSLGKDVW